MGKMAFRIETSEWEEDHEQSLKEMVNLFLYSVTSDCRRDLVVAECSSIEFAIPHMEN